MARGELPVGGHQGIIHIRPQPDQRCAVRERHQPAPADAGVGEWRPFGPAKKTTAGKDRIMIYGPKEDGTCAVKFRTAEGQVMAISVPRTETAIIRHFQERCLTDCSCRRCAGKEKRPTQKTSPADAGERLPNYRFHFLDNGSL
jgi:hypothetical protein